MPLALTNDRSAQGIHQRHPTTLRHARSDVSQISQPALAMLQATLPNGQYLIPSAQITNAALATRLVTMP